ncbi:hypothetical protein Fuma_03334 [Fuerstiella marisgermanici]|uniref:Uncharacterized protein n=1 Tax=Fuerstiella marisgermanici TaxID=1891926 RepID=A0A1P8WI27_9PLAN|nr:hypothetical protein Fuma_03334 [Fuerstiella marisgermanici]
MADLARFAALHNSPEKWEHRSQNGGRGWTERSEGNPGGSLVPRSNLDHTHRSQIHKDLLYRSYQGANLPSSMIEPNGNRPSGLRRLSPRDVEISRINSERSQLVPKSDSGDPENRGGMDLVSRRMLQDGREQLAFGI